MHTEFVIVIRCPHVSGKSPCQLVVFVTGIKSVECRPDTKSTQLTSLLASALMVPGPVGPAPNLRAVVALNGL